MTPNLYMEKILGILFTQTVGLNRCFGVYEVLAATAAGGPLAKNQVNATLYDLPQKPLVVRLKKLPCDLDRCEAVTSR